MSLNNINLKVESNRIKSHDNKTIIYFGLENVFLDKIYQAKVLLCLTWLLFVNTFISQDKKSRCPTSSHHSACVRVCVCLFRGH